MTAIYVKEQGAQVGKRGERLIVTKLGQTLDEIPLSKVDKLVVMGNVTMTTPALTAITERDIRVVYLSSHGKYRMHTERLGSSHTALRRQQYVTFGDDATRLRLAKQLVLGKITNQRTILQRQMRRTSSVDTALFQKGLRGMLGMRGSLEKANSLDQLRGYEGKAGAYYFEAVRSLVGLSWGFQRREYYPPPDPFNALLSFLYSLILKDMVGIIQIVGLDVGLGIFHEVQSTRPSLALDLMEEWRPTIADALALELVNRGTLTPELFQRTSNPKRPVELGQNGIRLVLEQYERRLQLKHQHPMTGMGGETTIKEIMRLQTRQIAQIISGKRTDFAPFLIR